MLEKLLDRFDRKIPKRLRFMAESPSHLGKWLRPDTPFWARSYYRAMTALRAQEFEERRRAANSLTALPMERIDPECGYLSKDLSDLPEIEAALARCDELRSSPGFREDVAKSKKGKYLGAVEFFPESPKDQPIFEIACHPAILGPIAQYLGTMPVLHRAALSFSPNKIFMGDSQYYHFDIEDYRQIKCFVFLDEVTQDSGPLTVIPARDSWAIYGALGTAGIKRSWGSRQEDQAIYGVTPVTGGIPMYGRRGEVLFVDTCNCYHFGSRPGKRERCLLYLHYASAFSIEMPVWGRQARRDAAKADGEAELPLVRRLVLGPYDRHFARRKRKVLRTVAASVPPDLRG